MTRAQDLAELRRGDKPRDAIAKCQPEPRTERVGRSLGDYENPAKGKIPLLISPSSNSESKITADLRVGHHDYAGTQNTIE